MPHSTRSLTFAVAAIALPARQIAAIRQARPIDWSPGGVPAGMGLGARTGGGAVARQDTASKVLPKDNPGYGRARRKPGTPDAAGAERAVTGTAGKAERQDREAVGCAGIRRESCEDALMFESSLEPQNGPAVPGGAQGEFPTCPRRR